MSMTREDVMRELELLPVWKLRTPIPAVTNSESVQSVVTTDKPAIENLVVSQTLSQAVLVASDDKKWIFVLPDELTNQASALFKNILLALHINKMQTSYTQQLSLDIVSLNAGVIVAMGEVIAQQLLVTTESIDSLRGKVHLINGLQVIATYHPNELLQHLPNKAKTWDDLCIALDALSA